MSDPKDPASIVEMLWPHANNPHKSRPAPNIRAVLLAALLTNSEITRRVLEEQVKPPRKQGPAKR